LNVWEIAKFSFREWLTSKGGFCTLNALMKASQKNKSLLPPLFLVTKEDSFYIEEEH
jgi:hypothetical protein